jgi:hypothetical protein
MIEIHQSAKYSVQIPFLTALLTARPSCETWPGMILILNLKLLALNWKRLKQEREEIE